MERQPFLAASPDAIVFCECCAKAVLEIKCPASSSRNVKQMECARTTCHCHGARTGRVVECSSCLATFHLLCIKLKRMPKSGLCTACQVAGQANMYSSFAKY
ncbi:uncharacterized protein LOC144175405 [Haemaphysalis longicornis]